MWGLRRGDRKPPAARSAPDASEGFPGVTRAVFLMPQIASLGQLQATQALRLLPFSSIVELLTGLTLDRVFPRLLKIEIPVEAALNVSGGTKLKRVQSLGNKTGCEASRRDAARDCASFFGPRGRSAQKTKIAALCLLTLWSGA
jgi:hypothetical protein